MSMQRFKYILKIFILCTRFGLYRKSSLRETIAEMALEKNQPSSDFLIDLQAQGFINENDVKYLLNLK